MCHLAGRGASHDRQHARMTEHDLCLSRGGIAVMTLLSREAAMRPNMSVFFAMPCHATPYYSHIHRNIPMAFPDCSPPGVGPSLLCTATRARPALLAALWQTCCMDCNLVASEADCSCMWTGGKD